MTTNTTINLLLMNISDRTKVVIYKSNRDSKPFRIFTNKIEARAEAPVIMESLYYSCDRVMTQGTDIIKIYLEE